MKIMQELGESVARVGSESPLLVNEELRRRGYSVEELSLVQWQSNFTLRQAFQRIAGRLWSRTWHLPDELFALSVERLQAEVLARFGEENLDKPFFRTEQFIAHRTRKPFQDN